jgi:hypothetical protein
MSLGGLFTEHPASVGESYLQHLRTAFGFALRMWIGGAACFVHALFPFLCMRTGSDCIAELNERMVRNRRRALGRIPLESHSQTVSLERRG